VHPRRPNNAQRAEAGHRASRKGVCTQAGLRRPNGLRPDTAPPVRERAPAPANNAPTG